MSTSAGRVSVTNAPALTPVRSVRSRDLRVGGFVPFTATDYPGHLAAVVFCQGCPWRCAYCHNSHLIPRRGARELAWSAIAAFLETRRGLLDAVVFSGGEPTLQEALADAMHEVKRLGFKVGLHTAGVYPHRLSEVLPLVDWVGMDVKAPFETYSRVTGVSKSGDRARESVRLIIEAGVAHEFRTTVDPSLLDASDQALLLEMLPRMGAARYVFQECRPPRA